MVTKDDVQNFLNQFFTKFQVFGIIFRDDRGKNKEAITQLEIQPSYREVVIKSLKPIDYIQGPIIDELNNMGEMWVFGKDVKNREVYIKINLGYSNSQTICISFHIAEQKLNYPFK